MLGMLALGLGLYFVIRFAVLRAYRGAEADPTIMGASRTVRCLYGGGDNDGMGSLVGNGVLAMTATSLVFVLGVPHRTMTIPRDSIRKVSQERTLRMPGRIRRGGFPWLVVEWSDNAGHLARAGFAIRDAQPWLIELASQPSQPSD